MSAGAAAGGAPGPGDRGLPTVGFVGAGAVGTTLALAFSGAGVTVTGASSRSPRNREAWTARFPTLPAGDDAQAVVDVSDLVLLTVSDDAIAPVCAGLRWSPDRAVVHCSGATELAALDTAAASGARVGGFHPLQMFTEPEVALAGLAGCTIGIEADADLIDDLEALAVVIGCEPFVLRPGTRALYHASAYYPGPFLIALLAEAVQLWRGLGADDGQALRALVPLLNGTVDAVLDGGLARGMGGCVARGDLGTIGRHLDALGTLDPAVASLYRQLALRNVPLALERGSIDPPTARRIEDLLT